MSRQTNRVFAGVLAATLLVHAALLAEIASAQCADPRGNAYCTNGGLVNLQNPNPPTNVNVQDPNAGNSNVQNPNAPIATATAGQLPVQPAGGAPGDVLVVSGQGFGSNNLMFLNVIDSSGHRLDTDSRAYTCNETTDWLLVLYQTYGLGCSGGARPGPLNHSNPDGTFSGAIQIPAAVSAGPAKLCAQGVFPTSCTPIVISGPDNS